MNNTQWLRKRLLERANVVEDVLAFGSVKDVEGFFNNQWCPAFEKLMRNRLVMGAFRYGPMYNQGAGFYPYLKYAKFKLGLYEVTGNTEFLVDVANLCMLAFIKGQHPNKHFEAVETGTHALDI